MLQAIMQELKLRSHELEAHTLESIYFGGGTPSLLSADDIGVFLTEIRGNYNVGPDVEITLEANPDDLTKIYLESIRHTEINRLSIGIQSFAENDLQYMNRAHNAAEATDCIIAAKECGFHNITIDLIYGSPTTSDAVWKQNIDTALTFDIPHISAYCLTVEENTALHHQIKKGLSQPLDQEKAIDQFRYLMSALKSAGYEHYEISNFAKPQSYAIHNTNYWRAQPYLGIGPSAHSYDGDNTRRWNIAHNMKYMKSLDEGKMAYEEETLTDKDKYNEYILTRLRTQWGIQTDILQNTYREYWVETKYTLNTFIEKGWLAVAGDIITLTTEGKLMADFISMELFAD